MFWGVEVGKAEGILIIFIVNMSRRRHHLSIVYHNAFIHHNINVKLSSSHSKEWTTHYTATDSVQSFIKGKIKYVRGLRMHLESIYERLGKYIRAPTGMNDEDIV